MGHPLIEEFGRIRGLGSMREQTFNRMQRMLTTEVQPLLDEREKLIEENAGLTAENAELKAKLAKKKPEAGQA